MEATPAGTVLTAVRGGKRTGQLYLSAYAEADVTDGLGAEALFEFS